MTPTLTTDDSSCAAGTVAPVSSDATVKPKWTVEGRRNDLAQLQSCLDYRREHQKWPPRSYVTTEGLQAGAWLRNQRQGQRHPGYNGRYTAPEIAEQLADVDPQWAAITRKPAKPKVKTPIQQLEVPTPGEILTEIPVSHQKAPAWLYWEMDNQMRDEVGNAWLDPHRSTVRLVDPSYYGLTKPTYSEGGEALGQPVPHRLWAMANNHERIHPEDDGVRRITRIHSATGGRVTYGWVVATASGIGPAAAYAGLAYMPLVTDKNQLHVFWTHAARISVCAGERDAARAFYEEREAKRQAARAALPAYEEGALPATGCDTWDRLWKPNLAPGMLARVDWARQGARFIHSVHIPARDPAMPPPGPDDNSEHDVTTAMIYLRVKRGHPDQWSALGDAITRALPNGGVHVYVLHSAERVHAALLTSDWGGQYKLLGRYSFDTTHGDAILDAVQPYLAT